MENADACWLCVCVCTRVCVYKDSYFPWLTKPLMSLPGRLVSCMACVCFVSVHICKPLDKQPS